MYTLQPNEDGSFSVKKYEAPPREKDVKEWLTSFDEGTVIRIPFSCFDLPDERKHWQFLRWYIEEAVATMVSFPFAVHLNYNLKEIKIIGVSVMEANFVVKLPYGERERYLDMMIEINDLVSSDGYCLVLVNNVPYRLEIWLAVKTSINQDAVQRIFEKNHLPLCLEYGIETLLESVGTAYDSMVTLLPGMDVATVKYLVQGLIHFPDKETYASMGHHLDADMKRKKKIFISYCHQDDQAVQCVVKKLKQHGLNLWVDFEEIDVGDSIMERVTAGIKECDLPIIFLSESTKQAQFAQHELRTFFREVIYGTKKWFIVRLDDVSPDTIYEGLGDYLYFDCIPKEEANMVEMMKQIERKLDRLEENRI